MAEPVGAPFWEERHEKIYRQARSLAVSKLETLEETAEKDLHGAARESIRLMAKARLLRLVVPKSMGGASEPIEIRSILAAREGIAYGSGLADALLALQGLGGFPLTLGGSPQQQKTWLPRIAKGEAIAGFAVTEPNAGSDVAAMTTRATKTPRGWQLDGTKTFISNAGLADYYTVFAKTDPKAGSKGVSCFLVPGTARGLKTEPLRLLASHPIGTLRFKNVRLPRDALVGAEGDGLKLAYGTLDRMRPSVAAAACGFARRALDEALARARSRKQFGKPIGENQGLRWRLADAATELEAARLLVHKAAWKKDMGAERITVEAAQAKLFATETAQRVVDFALQVHGGSGTVHGAIVERLYREVRALRIYEGTSEILREIIGRAIFPTAA
ncbi:MAG TPA: acyl-CoA dehydrogenase family protein [Candidatus Thermoplasmatota archaeon]|nr:acyl-CoA dehydrogenase family protein [Candidatus Thermoplasmatota archaeon]